MIKEFNQKRLTADFTCLKIMFGKFMLLHPLTLSIVLLDALSTLSLSGAALSCVSVISGWDKNSSSQKQLRLERLLDFTGLMAKFAFIFFIISSLILIYAVSNKLPDVVNGAMCGVGVLDASNGHLSRSIVFRVISFFILYSYISINRMSSLIYSPDLSIKIVRMVLLSFPVVYLSAVETVRVFMQIHADVAVNCCSIVYEAAGGFGFSAFYLRQPFVLLMIFFGNTFILSVIALTLFRRKTSLEIRWTRIYLVAVLFWIPLAIYMLVHVFTAGFFQVLQHDCMWCLFLKDQYGAGYFLFGSLTFLGSKSFLGLIILLIVDKDSHFWSYFENRIRYLIKEIFFMKLFFIILSVMPSLLWRIRFGVLLF